MSNKNLIRDDFADAILICHFEASGVNVSSQILSSAELQARVRENMNKVSELLKAPVCEGYEEIVDMSKRLAEAKEALSSSLDACVDRGIIPLSLRGADLS